MTEHTITIGGWHAIDRGHGQIEVWHDVDPYGELHSTMNVFDYELGKRDPEHPFTLEHLHALLTAYIDGEELPRVRRTDDRGIVLLDEGDPRATTCPVCHASWDDSVPTGWTPAPAGRCPWEADHDTACSECGEDARELSHNNDGRAVCERCCAGCNDDGWPAREITVRIVFGSDDTPPDATTLAQLVRDQLSGELGDDGLFAADVALIPTPPRGPIERNAEGSPTNAQRATWARHALITFGAGIGITERDIAADFTTAAGDLLGDLFHLAAEHDVTPDELVARGRFHFDEEVADAE